MLICCMYINNKERKKFSKTTDHFRPNQNYPGFGDFVEPVVGRLSGIRSVVFVQVVAFVVPDRNPILLPQLSNYIRAH